MYYKRYIYIIDVTIPTDDYIVFLECIRDCTILQVFLGDFILDGIYKQSIKLSYYLAILPI